MGDQNVTNNGFFSKYYVLTRDGFTYEIYNNGQNGRSFNSFVNNWGSLDATTHEPDYTSFSYSNVSEIRNKIHDPRDNDDHMHVTHKMFYTIPDASLPDSAFIWALDESAISYAGNGSTQKTWLSRNRDETLQPKNLRLEGKEGAGSLYTDKGGYFVFDSDVEGTYRIEVPAANPANNVVLTGRLVLGENRVFWDGKDAAGNSMIGGTELSHVKIQLSAAEIHFPFFDVESNVNGIEIQALDPSNNYYSPTRDTVFWNIPNSLTGTNPPTTYVSNVNGLPSTGIKTNNIATNKRLYWGENASAGDSQFGNNKGIVIWTNRVGKSHETNLDVTKLEIDLEVESVSSTITSTSSPTPGAIMVGDQLSYTIKIKNNGGGDATITPLMITLRLSFSMCPKELILM